MKRFILLLAILPSLFYAQQEEREKRDSTITATQVIYAVDGDEAFAINHKGTIPGYIQRAWKANQEPSYLTLAPFVSPIGERRVALRDGEGESSNFSLMEANLNFQFTLAQGKDRWESNFWKMNRITFDYNGTFRMLLDNSKPLTPGNQRVGFSWNTNIWTSELGYALKSGKENIRLSNCNCERLHFVNAKISAHHFSNGQPPGFFYTDPETDLTRNDYQSGDFSTNYLLVENTYGRYNINRNNLHQFSLGYRQDWGQGEDGFLIFSNEQAQAYGKRRLFFIYDYRQGFQNKNEIHLRAQLWHILGNLDNFQANLTEDTSKYRTYAEFEFEFAPRDHRTIAYFLRIFYGRDYLNIRYDDIIFTTQFGISLNLDKYRSRHGNKEIQFDRVN